jgi:hypothetical protein
MSKKVTWVLLGTLILAACASGGVSGASALPTSPVSLPLSPVGTPIGQSKPTGGSAAEMPQGAVIVYRRSGGISGVSEEWVVYDDGRLTAASGEEWRVAPEPVAQLVAGIEGLGFFGLEENYVPRDTCCDRFTYELTVRSAGRVHTVTALDATPDTPDEVWEALRAVGQFIAEATG